MRAVDEVTFDVGSGTVFGLLGRNGAGKSTLVKMLAGHLEPSSGRAAGAGGAGFRTVEAGSAAGGDGVDGSILVVAFTGLSAGEQRDVSGHDAPAGGKTNPDLALAAAEETVLGVAFKLQGDTGVVVAEGNDVEAFHGAG